LDGAIGLAELIGNIGGRFSSEWRVVFFRIALRSIRPKRYRRDPTGKSPGQFSDPSVQPSLQKYSDFPKTQISFITLAVPSHRGALRNVTKRGAGCGGRGRRA
jgi:hypothetical protein